jgi:predicted SnoaL-like aldol condensation-catalyzing enzyme
MRSAREVVETYILADLNERAFDLARDLFADSVVHHNVGSTTALPRDRVCERIEETWARVERMRFELNLVIAGDDGEHVAIVCQAGVTTPDGVEAKIASIGVFRVVAGRITELWNCNYRPGVWK